MAEPRILRIYLEPDELKRARDGGFNVMNRIKSAFEWEGFRVDFCRNSPEEREKAITRRGLALYHMEEPNHDRALCLRRAYYYPYWRIEATNQRWNFRVARKPFDSAEIDTDAARTWAGNWRKWLFKGKAERPTRDGVIYVPLQGRLLEHRSFQSMSPVDMINAVRDAAGDRRILLGLHPGEQYSAAEVKALEAIADRDRRVQIQTGGMEEALARCDVVVTENSSAALSGFFFGKPAILCAQIDFHHVALDAGEMGIAAALDAAVDHAPDYDAYLYWFIQLNAFKADKDGVETDIIASVRALGWPV